MPLVLRTGRWQRRGLLGGLAAIGLLLVGAPASADLDAYLTLSINGVAVPGDVTTPGREDTIRVHAVSFDGFSPVRAGGGLSAPQSRPISVLVEADRSAPALLGAWASGSAVTSAVIQFYEPSQTGSEVNHLTLTLVNGRVSSYSVSSPDNLDPDLAARPMTVLVGFTYSTAVLEHGPSGQSQGIGWQ